MRQQDHDLPSISGQDTIEITGRAALAFLPDGRVSGHLACSGDSSKGLGIMARELTQRNPECFQGPDWKLLRVTVIDFTSNREYHTLVEATGLDAARWRPVKEDHGSMQEMLRVADVVDAIQTVDSDVTPSEAAIQVFFDCEALLADAKAEEHVCRFLPSLSGHAELGEAAWVIRDVQIRYICMTCRLS